MLMRSNSSAHWLYSPACYVTKNSMWCRAAQPAANFRKDPKGSEVLQSFSARASAAVLSDALGSANFQVVAPSALRATIARPSCASVAKQAMYCCGLPVSRGQADLICSAVQCLQTRRSALR